MKLTEEQKKHEYKNMKKYFEDKNYELISDKYEGANEPIYYICPKHRDKGILSTTWSRCKSRGSGCRYCATEYTNGLKRVSEIELKELTKQKGFIYDHVEYKKGKSIIFFYCKKHYDKGLQSKLLGDMRRSSGKCKYCSGREKSDEDFKKEMYEKFPYIDILTKYKNATSKLKCKCLKCGYEWNTNANNLKGQKYGCAKCANKRIWDSRRKTTDDFKKEIFDIYGNNISILSEYIGSHDKVKCKCNIDDTIWEATPTNLLTSKIACPTCCGLQTSIRCKKTNEEFIKQLNEVNPNIIPLEAYVDDHKKILCSCKIHKDYKWMVMPNKILHKNTGCPRCAKSVSSNEIKLQNILLKWGYKFETQKRFKDCKDKYSLPFDIYLIDFNILIEYDGEQHYKIINRDISNEKKIKNLEIIQKHDIIKNEYCKNKNIPLIRIPYWEQDDLECFLFDNLVKHKAIEKIK